jgi:LuxR family quorum sensing-dependent transcriptional regulator
LGANLLRFASSVNKLATPDQVLDGLHRAIRPPNHLSVLGALLFPVRWDDMSGLVHGNTLFLHKSVPKGWWEEWVELVRASPNPNVGLIQLALAPFTASEALRMLEPLGVDRWPHELALKYGLRDRLACPVGGRWVVVFWSSKVLTSILSEEERALLFMGASFAAIRLQKLIDPSSERIGKGASLTPRELAVLRLQSIGKRIKETAEHLGLGEETVRTHLKKAQTKLGVHDRAHAVAQAIRWHLIP